MSTYTIRIWINGVLHKEFRDMDKKEARDLWNEWDNREGCGHETFEGDRRLTYREAERIFRRRKKMSKMVVGGQRSGAARREEQIKEADNG